MASFPRMPLTVRAAAMHHVVRLGTQSRLCVQRAELWGLCLGPGIETLLSLVGRVTMESFPNLLPLRLR